MTTIEDYIDAAAETATMLADAAADAASEAADVAADAFGAAVSSAAVVPTVAAKAARVVWRQRIVAAGIVGAVVAYAIWRKRSGSTEDTTADESTPESRLRAAS